MHSPTTIMVDHVAEKDSAVDRVDTVQNVIMEMRRERARMEYLSAVENGCKGKWFGGLVRSTDKSYVFAQKIRGMCANLHK